MFIALYVVGHSTTHMRNSWKEGTRTLDLWITSQAKSPRCVRSTPHELKRYAHINSGSVSYSFSDCPQRCQLSTILPSAMVTGNAIPRKIPNLSSMRTMGSERTYYSMLPVLDVLPHSSAPINTTATHQTQNRLTSFERLPSELIVEISDFVPD